MKKSILVIAALVAAFAVNAADLNIDLSKYAKAGDNADDVTPSLAAGVLTVAYNFPAAWGNGGVEFTLDNLDVTNMAFDYKGDAAATKWVSFQVYLKDSKGGLWYSSEQDLAISAGHEDWASVSYMPADVLWSTTTDPTPAKPFVALGFLANPSEATNASFAIRNVKLTYNPATGIDNANAEVKAVKTIKDGQMVIVREGKTFNALGAEVK